MKSRLDPYATTPELMKAMASLDAKVHSAGLERSLIELVKTRASQVNGCAYCIFVHTRDARARGETEERLYLLDAWRESPLYSDRERAALAWTEALTLISVGHAPDDVFSNVRGQFNDAELAQLTLLIATINAWNRIAISFRIPHSMPATAQVSIAGAAE